MNLMEATIFAILISTPPSDGPAFSCRITDDPKQALCSNDLVIKEFQDGTLEFGSKVTVKKDRRRDLISPTASPHISTVLAGYNFPTATQYAAWRVIFSRSRSRVPAT